MKLNKTQINAIAEKAVRDLRTAFKAKEDKARKAYVPSPEYTRVKELLDKRENLKSQVNKIEEELHKYCGDYGLIYWQFDCLLAVIMKKELNIDSVDYASVQADIATDLTIKTIDSSFNPYEFIEEVINKYVNS